MKLGVGIFFFHAKLLAFSGAGCSFWYLFCQFLVIFSCKTSGFLRGWVVFLSKNRQFFYAKLQFLRGWVVFLVPFLSLFCHFFMQNFSFLRGWEVFLSKKDNKFHAKLHFLGGWVVFLSKKMTFSEIFEKVCAEALKRPSLARSVPKPLKAPSLARSVPKPL